MPSAISRDELLFKIKNILIERFGLENAQLEESAKLRDLGVDSMHVVEILLDLEDELGTKLEGLSMPPNPSLADVVDTLAKNFPLEQANVKKA